MECTLSTIYPSTIFKYNFEVLVLYLSISFSAIVYLYSTSTPLHFFVNFGYQLPCSYFAYSDYLSLLLFLKSSREGIWGTLLAHKSNMNIAFYQYCILYKKLQCALLCACTCVYLELCDRTKND